MDFLEVLSYLLIYIVLPGAGIAALIYLSIVLAGVAKSLKGVDKIMDDVEHKLDLLNGPIEFIGNLDKTIASLVKMVKSKKSGDE